jgi:hypothetical protein
MPRIDYMQEAMEHQLRRLEDQIIRERDSIMYRGDAKEYYAQRAAFLDVLMMQRDFLLREYRKHYAPSYRSDDPYERARYESYYESHYDPTTGRPEGVRGPSGRPTRNAADWVNDFVRDFNKSNDDSDPFSSGTVYERIYREYVEAERQRATGSPPPQYRPPKNDAGPTINRIKVRISKIERLARDPGATPGERASAQAMADKLRRQQL